MGNFLDLRGAATRTRDQLFIQLLLKVFETGKPALEAVLFLAQKIVDDHNDLGNTNKIAARSCQPLGWRYSARGFPIVLGRQ